MGEWGSGLVPLAPTWHRGCDKAQCCLPRLQVLLALEPLRELLLCMQHATKTAAAALGPADANGQAIDQLCTQLEGLSKKQPRSRAVLEQLRRGMEAPLAACAARVAAAATAEAAEPGR